MTLFFVYVIFFLYLCAPKDAKDIYLMLMLSNEFIIQVYI